MRNIGTRHAERRTSESAEATAVAGATENRENSRVPVYRVAARAALASGVWPGTADQLW